MHCKSAIRKEWRGINPSYSAAAIIKIQNHTLREQYRSRSVQSQLRAVSNHHERPWIGADRICADDIGDPDALLDFIELAKAQKHERTQNKIRRNKAK